MTIQNTHQQQDNHQFHSDATLPKNECFECQLEELEYQQEEYVEGQVDEVIELGYGLLGEKV